MDNKKIVTFALAGVLALGGTATVFAANVTPLNSPKTVAVEQAAETETQDENVVLPAGGIDQATAEQKAQASIPGGVIVTSELEDENGVIVYGVEIKTGNAVHDVKVDSITGEILKSDQDNEKDEKGKAEEESKAGDNDNIQHENDNEDPNG